MQIRGSAALYICTSVPGSAARRHGVPHRRDAQGAVLGAGSPRQGWERYGRLRPHHFMTDRASAARAPPRSLLTAGRGASRRRAPYAMAAARSAPPRSPLCGEAVARARGGLSAGRSAAARPGAEPLRREAVPSRPAAPPRAAPPGSRTSYGAALSLSVPGRRSRASWRR